MIRFVQPRKRALAAAMGLVVGVFLTSTAVNAKEPSQRASKNAASVRNVVKTAVPAARSASNTSISRQVVKTSYSLGDAKAKLYQSGVASYYGPGFHGRRTANGETFNMNAMTAAHKTLPFGTLLKVTNQANGKSAIVRVNDRGPYAGGRIIDLSVAAAKQIGSTHSGTARVTLEVIN